MRNRYPEIVITIFCFILLTFAQEERKQFLSPFVGCGFSLGRFPIELPNGSLLTGFAGFSMNAICQALFETNQDIYWGLEFGIISPYNYSYGKYSSYNKYSGQYLPIEYPFAKLGLLGIVTEIQNNNIFYQFSAGSYFWNSLGFGVLGGIGFNIIISDYSIPILFRVNPIYKSGFCLVNTINIGIRKGTLN